MALGYLLDNNKLNSPTLPFEPFWLISQNEFRRQMPNFRVHGHKYAKYATLNATVMYVRMATWPIASRDVVGTRVPRLFTVVCR